ncbi:MAG: tyrosine-type recombinase/integrase [Atribacterota bacterium]
MPKIFTKSEVLEMTQDADEPELKALIAVLISTGARVSEIVSLKGKDISSDEKRIYFNMKVLKKRSDKSKRVIRPVSKKSYFMSFFIDYINNYAEITPDEPIFSYTRNSLWRALKRLNPDAHPHKFRHTLATWMLEKVDMRTAQEWFQWTNMKTAETYTHPTDAINTFSTKMDEVLE